MGITEKDIEALFDAFLDETYEPYKIFNAGDPYDQTGIELYPASILKSTDPIAYQSFLNDWADRYGLEESDDSDNEDDEDDSDNEEDLELLDMHRHSDDEDDSDIPYDRVQTGADESDDSDDSDNECEGHESLSGDMMGVSDFCDGSCKRKN